jgi:hypothetical protein
VPIDDGSDAVVLVCKVLSGCVVVSGVGVAVVVVSCVSVGVVVALVVVMGTGHEQVAPPHPSTHWQNDVAELSARKHTAFLPQSAGNKHTVRHTPSKSQISPDAHRRFGSALHGVSEQSGPLKCSELLNAKSHVQRPVIELHNPACEHPFGHRRFKIVGAGTGVGAGVVGGGVGGTFAAVVIDVDEAAVVVVVVVVVVAVVTVVVVVGATSQSTPEKPGRQTQPADVTPRSRVTNDHG